MSRLFFITAVQSLMATVLALALLSVGHAQVMNSTNYSLESDSVNFGGGLSSSTNFTQESTFGEIATGLSSSTNFTMRAGYQQMQEVFISLTPPANVIMDTPLGGLTGGTSNGSTSFQVITDSPSGYVVIMSAEDAPAMNRTAGLETIADYPASTTPDFNFTFSSSDAVFGYTVEGIDITVPFQDNGALCNITGGDTSDSCWRGFATSTVAIVSNGSANHPAGATSTLKFRVGIGSTGSVIAGTYIATSTLTALPL